MKKIIIERLSFMKSCTVFSLIALFFVFQQAVQAKELACKRYAQEAVRQNQQNLQLQAGFKPPVWSSDYRGHLNWCMHGGNVNSTPMHLADRERALQEYVVKNQGRDSAAKRYSTEAVRQYQQSVALGTGFKPPVWSDNFDGHYQWSKHGGNIAATPRHLADREKALQEFAIRHNKGPVAAGGMSQGHVIKKVVKFEPLQDVLLKAAEANKTDVKGIDDKVVAKPLEIKPKILSRIDHPSKKESPNFAFDSDADSFMYYPTDHHQKVGLGSGYDTLNGKVMSSAIDIVSDGYGSKSLEKPNQQFGFVTEVKSDYVSTMEDYWENLGVSVKVSGSYMGFSGSSETDFDRTESNNSFSEKYVASVFMETFVEYVNQSEAKLKPEALAVLKNHGVNEFYKRYGDTYLEAIYYGAALQGVASYNAIKEDDSYKLVTKNKTSGNWLFAGYSAEVDVEKSIKRKKENVEDKGVIRSFGAGLPVLQRNKSVNMLKDLLRKFPARAAAEARRSIGKRKYGGIIRYEVKKYSSLPEFAQVAGQYGLDLSEQRKLLFDLNYYKKKIGYMMNNLDYIIKNPDEFKPNDVRKALVNKKDLQKWVRTVNQDLFTLKKYPLDRSKWNFSNNYNHIPNYAPDTRFAKVKFRFPADPERPKAGERDWVDDNEGPLIGFNHTGGDGNGYGNKMAIDINTKLLVSPDRKEVKLRFQFKSVETQGDHTTYQGVKPLYTVYHAPENHIIVGLKKSEENYKLRSLFKNQPWATDGAAILNVHLQKSVYPDFNFSYWPVSSPPSEPLWPNLSVIFDTRGDDSQQGAFGDLVFDVELKPVRPY